MGHGACLCEWAQLPEKSPQSHQCGVCAAEPHLWLLVWTLSLLFILCPETPRKTLSSHALCSALSSQWLCMFICASIMCLGSLAYCLFLLLRGGLAMHCSLVRSLNLLTLATFVVTAIQCHHLTRNNLAFTSFSSPCFAAEFVLVFSLSPQGNMSSSGL